MSVPAPNQAPKAALVRGRASGMSLAGELGPLLDMAAPPARLPVGRSRR
jgi:hypothetical protein